jgi:hypothetical protein
MQTGQSSPVRKGDGIHVCAECRTKTHAGCAARPR